MSSQRLRGLCLVHVFPAGAEHRTQDLLCFSAWPSLAPASHPGWGMRSSERPRSPQAKGQTCWESQSGRTMGQCPAAAGPQWEKPWARSSTEVYIERPRWPMGSPPGDPSVHGSGWTMEKGVTLEPAQGSGSSSAHLALSQLLVSPDGVPHGHRPAQRGQHLVPVRGAHATS